LQRVHGILETIFQSRRDDVTKHPSAQIVYGHSFERGKIRVRIDAAINHLRRCRDQLDHTHDYDCTYSETYDERLRTVYDVLERLRVYLVDFRRGTYVYPEVQSRMEERAGMLARWKVERRDEGRDGNVSSPTLVDRLADNELIRAERLLGNLSSLPGDDGREVAG
jgi:hypothetical protein